MGGVLIDIDFNKTLNRYFDEKYHQLILKEVFQSSLWRDMDCGVKRVEDVIPVMLSKLPQELHSRVSEMVSNFYPYMPPLEYMEDFVIRLKKAGYKIYLLSNATPRFFDEYQNIPALSYFDGFFISALYKLLKPQPEIYQAFCEKFNLMADECFFIDDMAINIDGAKAFGMQGFVFDTKDVKALEKELNANGVVF